LLPHDAKHLCSLPPTHMQPGQYNAWHMLLMPFVQA
jgi:hypothetical protein